MKKTWTSHEDASRIKWGSERGPGEYPTTEQINLGAIARIATALERIADLMDPEVVKRKAEEAKWKNDRQEQRRLMLVIENKVIDFIGDAMPARFRTKVASHVPSRMWNSTVVRSGNKESQLDAFRTAAEAFDAATFDYASVEFPTKTQEQVTAFLASRQIEPAIGS